MTTLDSPRSPAIEANDERYGVWAWGEPYFSINDAGRIQVSTPDAPGRTADLYEIVRSLGSRGLQTPLLIRFSDVLRHRLHAIASAFESAIASEEYQGGFCCVFPIKVNQQRLVVEEVRDEGRAHGFGLEAGSKPELVAVLGMTARTPDTPIICNGYKDADYIRALAYAWSLGRDITAVIERARELDLILEQAASAGVRPQIGLRAKLATAGAGRWEGSTGMRSKFGLFISELLEGVEKARAAGMLDCVNLLHYHLGSQTSDIRAIKDAVTELAYIYVELRRLGAPITRLDIGGGLAVDYDGSKSNAGSSMNYTLEEYAADVVYRIRTVCDEADTPHPQIVIESGRATVSHASVLVFNVEAASTFVTGPPPASPEELTGSLDDVPQPVLDLFDAYEHLSDDNVVEAYHDISHARGQVLQLFALGGMTLPVRAGAERLFWSAGREILERAARLEEFPSELDELPAMLADTYYCNLSIFQSLPDWWAIDHLFPICPIHRLNEEPTRQTVLVDMTCDSDGRIDRFAHPEGARSVLDVHELSAGKPYLLAAFLVGAYQEILGDYHNLFGDTDVAHIALGEGGSFEVMHDVRGDSINKVLSYVQIDGERMLDELRREAADAVQKGVLDDAGASELRRFFQEILQSSTYLR